MSSPAAAGVRFAWSKHLAAALRVEIGAQVERFARFGLAAVYWDGHTHLHLHPTVLRLTVPIAATHGFRFTRLVRTPGSRGVLALIFRALSQAAIPQLKAHRVQFTDHVFGLRETGRMSAAAMQRLITDLPTGVSEIYFHPGAEPGPLEAQPLLDQLHAGDIELTNSERLLAATH
jgi:predicted glycoside hydrolase/deacetylase ChbG (UPF0249 family)